MAAGSAFCQQRRGSGFHADDLHIGILFSQITAYTSDGAAGTNACYKNIHFAVGIFVDFRTCGFIMCLRVCRVIKLSGNECTGDFFCQFFRFGNGTSHAFCTFCQHQFRTKSRHEQTAFHTHAVRHNDDGSIASCRCHNCQTNARIAAGRFDDGSACFQNAFCFCVFHHFLCHRVFGTAAGVQKLHFCQNCCIQIMDFFQVCQFQ